MKTMLQTLYPEIDPQEQVFEKIGAQSTVRGRASPGARSVPAHAYPANLIDVKGQASQA
jgi:hypothetical protein